MNCVNQQISDFKQQFITTVMNGLVMFVLHF